MEKLPKPEYSVTFDNFYSNQQIKKCVVQFMAIFSGMYVSSGKNDFNNPTNLIPVEIRYGNADRVVDAIISANTINKPIRLPIMAVNISNIALNYDRMKGMDQVEREVLLPRGGAVPNDLKAIYRHTANPIKITFELSIRTSNSFHLFEIIEQILLLFNPTIQLQTSDGAFDNTKIHTVDLTDLSFDGNYPSGQDQRIMGATLTFDASTYIAGPANIKDNLIKKIRLRIDAIHTYENTQEVAEDVGRPFPEYSTLFDIDEFDVPK